MRKVGFRKITKGLRFPVLCVIIECTGRDFMNDDVFEAMKECALNSENYKKSRESHTAVFGRIFSESFCDNEIAAIYFTSALNLITNKRFDEAGNRLEVLATMCAGEHERAAVHYFAGLAFEFLGDTAKACEHYRELLEASVKFEYQLLFHPYYRTAKLANKNELEMTKSLYYYRKALEFYDGTEPQGGNAETVSFILYDAATVSMIMHRYGDAQRFMELSYRYSHKENQQREYVMSILEAIVGNADGCNARVVRLNGLFRDSARAVTERILAGSDIHYFAVEQDRSKYGEFIDFLCSERDKLCDTVSAGDTEAVSELIGARLTQVLGFMHRRIECRIETDGGKVTVICKNYYTKSLMAEYAVLLARANGIVPGWTFIQSGDLNYNYGG